MAKISLLPEIAAEALDGSETVPFIKGGVTSRAALSSLVSWLVLPFVERAKAWAQADTAPDPGNPSGKSAKTYRNEALAARDATLVALQPVQDDLDGLGANFDQRPPKNLADPSLALDGVLYNYVGGATGAFPNSLVTGLHPVAEGKTYALSLPASETGFFPHLYAWSADGSYIGMSNPAPSGSNPPVIDALVLTLGRPSGTGGWRAITFTVPVGSGIRFIGTMALFPYAAHTAADFDRIRNAIQLEEGAAPTAFEPYRENTIFDLKEEAIPGSIQRAEPVAPVLDAFDVVESPNLYDPSNARDGVLVSFATGLPTTYANGMDLGKIAVEPGKTYCVWMGDPLGFHNLLPIYCYDAFGAYLGIDHTIGGTTGMANPPTSVVWTGRNQVVFTIPAGSAIRFVQLMAEYSTHEPADFNRVIATIQAEEGAEPTAYQPYAPTGIARLKETALRGASAGPLTVVRSYPYLYIRSGFDANNDAIQLIRLVNTAPFVNNIVNVQGIRKAAKSKKDTATAWTSGTVLQTSGDDSAPLNYGGTYIDGNHGATIVLPIQAPGHGKAVQDVGSEWTDGAGVKWYLMRVVDLNNLWFVSANKSAYPEWSFTSVMTGNLTHSAGATNTGGIAVGTKATTQLWPSSRTAAPRVLLDDKTEITTDGEYKCSTLSIVESHDILNPASVVQYVRSQVGGSTQPAFNHASVAVDVRRTLTYRYAENGSCCILDTVRGFNTLPMGYLGVTQAQPLNFAGKQLWQYIPRVNAITGTIKTWNFEAQEDISGSFEELHAGAAVWKDANNPPDRMAQIVKAGGVAEFGLMVGVSSIRGVGPAAVRKTLVNDALFVSAARKQYPKAVSVGSITPTTYYEMVGFRAFWPASNNTDATAFVWYRDGDAIVVIADFHKAVSLSRLDLPDLMNGMNWAVTDKSASMTVHGNGVVGPDGLLVSCSASYGYAVIKLTK